LLVSFSSLSWIFKCFDSKNAKLTKELDVLREENKQHLKDRWYRWWGHGGGIGGGVTAMATVAGMLVVTAVVTAAVAQWWWQCYRAWKVWGDWREVVTAQGENEEEG